MLTHFIQGGPEYAMEMGDQNPFNPREWIDVMLAEPMMPAELQDDIRANRDEAERLLAAAMGLM